MVSNAPAMHRVWEMIDRVAPSSMVVSVTGETGTGKELVACALHARSTMAKGPFVPINCAALDPALADSELFGHERGAFTGADSRRTGAFEEARGGTLFLDEIAELPLATQAKLLRAIETGEIRRLGAEQATRVDVRVVVATNKDLRAEVQKGTFRDDLLWRFAIHLVLPPLRERQGDLPILIDHFLAKLSPPNSNITLSVGAERCLLAHSWPGNVRELRNVLQRALCLRKSALIEESQVMFDPPAENLEGLRVRAESRSISPTPWPSALRVPQKADDFCVLIGGGKSLETIIDEVMAKTLKRTGAVTRVAKDLQVSRGSVYRRFATMGLLEGTANGSSKGLPLETSAGANGADADGGGLNGSTPPDGPVGGTQEPPEG